MLASYAAALEGSPLADSSKAKYRSRVRGFLAFIAQAAADGVLDGDPLTDPAAAGWAVRDYRRHLKNGRRAPTIRQTAPYRVVWRNRPRIDPRIRVITWSGRHDSENL